VASIRLRGILQPILLRPKGEVYAIVAGERRYRAGLEAYGPDGEVPVIIREMTDQEALDAAIAENDDRDDPSETEQADAAVRYLAACQNDRTEAARRLGWSRSKLDRRLALAELSDAVKLALDERRIKVGHAELLAAVPGDKQDKALETILAAELDVGKTRELLMRVTQNLAAACFDKTECTTCPFNSASQRTLFETHVDDGHCTNPGCFELKTQTAEAIRFEEQERAEKAARAAALPSTDDPQGGERDDDDDGGLDDTETETDASPVDRTEPRAPAPLLRRAAAPPRTSRPSRSNRSPAVPATCARRSGAPPSPGPSRPMPSMPIPPFSSPPCRARFPRSRPRR
jgi:ParB/RepB/Spo0J family partition protein